MRSPATGPVEVTDEQNRIWTYRHPVLIRVTHWVNAVCLIILLMSGLQIFNAHPALNWGQVTNFETPVLEMKAIAKPGGGTTGVTVLAGHTFGTDGILGQSLDQAGLPDERGFPSWITLPGQRDLGGGRRWHFFFAWLFILNGLGYLAYSFATGHIQKGLWPTREGLAHIGTVIKEHALLRFPKGDEARRYNVLQQLTYVAVIFVLLPLTILAGLTMSPSMDAGAPWLLDLFGGRQSARTVHFLGAVGITLFIIVHIVLVIISGLWNNMRSMVTGYYTISKEG